MSNDNHNEELAVVDAAEAESVVETTEESVNEAQPTVEVAEAPITEAQPLAEVTESVTALEDTEILASSQPIVPLDVLLVVFKKRTVDSIAPTLWAEAVAAVKQGKTVLLRGSAPHLVITEEPFAVDGKLTAGSSSPASVLNNLLVGMI